MDKKQERDRLTGMIHHKSCTDFTPDMETRAYSLVERGLSAASAFYLSWDQCDETAVLNELSYVTEYAS